MLTLAHNLDMFGSAWMLLFEMSMRVTLRSFSTSSCNFVSRRPDMLNTSSDTISASSADVAPEGGSSRRCMLFRASERPVVSGALHTSQFNLVRSSLVGVPTSPSWLMRVSFGYSFTVVAMLD